MPQAELSADRRGRKSVSLWALLGGLIVFGPGCQKHYYYYYGNSGNCPPVAPSSIVDGPVCDVSGQVIEGGTVVSSVASDPPPVSRSRRNKVVVSEANRPGRSSWTASGPESSMARTQVEGAMDESVVK
jgi:hypothetical protein